VVIKLHNLQRSCWVVNWRGSIQISAYADI
jgi:hypothetical protein